MTNHNSSPEDNNHSFPARAVAIGAVAIFATSAATFAVYETVANDFQGTSLVNVSGIYKNLVQSHDADK